MEEYLKNEPELNSEGKKLMTQLEGFNFLSLKDKILLTLVWRKMISAIRISVSENALSQDVEKLKEIIKKMGLFLKQEMGQEHKNFGALKDREIFFVSDTETNLELFSQLWFRDHMKDTEAYKKMGRLSGFPDTAIDTYGQFSELQEPEREKARKKLVLSEAEKKELIDPQLYPLSLLFYMSRAHWRIELETIRKWVKEIQLTLPELYKLYTNQINSENDAKQP